MGKKLKIAVAKMKIDGALEKFHAITSYEAVGKEFNEDGKVKTSLKDELEAFATALAEKANSTKVTQEIQAACKDLYNKILGKTDDTTTIDEAYDTLKEIADWLTGHGEAAATLTSDVAALKTNVQTILEQMETIKSTAVEASEINGNIKVNGTEVQVYRNPGKNVFVAKTETEEASAEQKMEDGDMLFCIVQDTIELKDASSEVKAANKFVGNFSEISTEYGGIEGDPYTFQTTYYGTDHTYDGTDHNLATDDILYIDNTTIYDMEFRHADLATGSLRNGSDNLVSGELTLPTGYYKVKKYFNASTINNNESNCIWITFGTFDSSGTVTALTEETVNSKNTYIEYLGASYEVSI